MNTTIKDLLLLPVLIAGLGLIPAGRVTAQSFTILHSFTATSGPYPYYTNSDGALPNDIGGLILSGNTLYGTAAAGGTSGVGTVFAININGTGFTTLHSFTALGIGDRNSDGAYPFAGLLLSGNTLYGTAHRGGTSANGTVFKVNTNGTGFTNLYNFTAGPYDNSDGAEPYAGLILSGNTLYGTANRGGSSDHGTVFKVNTDGTGFTNLHSFTGGSAGANPTAGLILSGNTLYGTAGCGCSGYGDGGTVFAININGTGFTNLYSFTGSPVYGDPITNSYGAFPGGLILSGNTLYGIGGSGGSSANGTVFAIHTDGTGLTNLHNFTATSGPLSTNSDGAGPNSLFLSGNTLYGGTGAGGSSGFGTVFAINTNGTGFTTLYSFTIADSSAGSVLSGNTLYGTTYRGGSSDNGTVFSRSLLVLPPPPQLTIIPYGGNVILTWPTNNAVFTLQSTTNLVSPAVWSANSPGPVVIGGQNVVFNPITGPQKFYRLSK